MTVLLALLLVIAPSLGLAASVPLRQLVQMPLQELMELQITTASRQPEKLAEAPAHTVVILRQQMRERGYRNLLDLLEDQPGFLIQHANAPGARFNTITWRGFRDNPHFQLMLDGIRVDSPTGEPITIDDNFPLNHAQRVEIVYGPSSAIYGADAAAGVINIISEQRITHPSADLQLEQGSFGEQRLTMQAAAPLGSHLSLSVSGQIQRADTANLSHFYPQDFSPVDAKTFADKVVVAAANRERFRAPTKNSSLYAQLHVGKQLTLMAHRSYNRHSSAVGYKLADSLYNDQAHWSTELTTLAATHQWQISDAVSLRSEIHGRQHEVKPDSAFLNIFTDFNRYYKYGRSRVIGIDEQLSWQRDAHLISLGIAYDRLQSIPKTADLPMPYQRSIAASKQGFSYANTNLPIQVFDVRYATFGLFAQLKSRWGHGFTSTLGLRYDRDSRFAASFNPRAALTYQLDSGAVIKLLYAEAFRSPSTQDTYENFGSFSGSKDASGRYTSSFFHLPNPTLRPEKVRNAEVELNAPLGEQGGAALSLFHYWTQDLILTQSAGSNSTFIAGSSITNSEINSNIGSSRQYGAELSLHWQHYVAANTALKLWGNYSYLQGSIAQRGGGKVDLPYITDHVGQLGATLDVDDWLQITPRLRLVGRINSPKVNKTNPSQRQQAAGYGIVDLHIAARICKRELRVSVDLRNLLDRRYDQAGGLSVASLVRVPQPPRTIRVAMEVAL